MAKEAKEKPGRVEVVVTADHVFLLLGEDGQGRDDWATSSAATTRVPRRARLAVPADLAEFLSARDQAEIVRADIVQAAGIRQ